MNDLSYNNLKPLTDTSLMKMIGEFIQHHRLNQNKSQAKVAKEAGISRSTLSLLERGQTVRMDSLIQVLRVLDLLHIMEVFKIEEQISPIAYAKLQKNKRKHASPQLNEPKDIEDLGW